ncbi:MAG: hypothetical protein AAFR87_07570 [Bacteroidota bacterium]
MAEQMFERIEAYLEGILPEDERLQFESELQTNPELKEEYFLQKDTRSLLKLGGQLAFKEKLKRIDQEIESEAKVVSFKKPLWRETWFQVAAVVLLLIGTGYLWMSNNYNKDQLIQQAFAEYNADPFTSRGNDDSPFAQAMQAYNSGNFEQASKSLQDILDESPDNIDAIHYLGISLYASGYSKEALPYLERSADSVKHGEAGRWIKILACFDVEGKDKCMHELSLLATEEGHPYQENAEKLYDRLNSVWGKMFAK